MAKRRERVRQCRQIRQLVEDNKYKKALELIDELPLEEVGSLDDLYLYAELYEKAERMDKKKEIYYLIYDRTKSRHVLNRLLRLTIRLGDMDEARELYFAYEVLGCPTLDTYELRYLLAKAEGEPRTRLIGILEELKKEEYTEEWGLQLARLYEQEGLREKCIQECKDLKLWFGEGKLVDKAMELMHRCQSPNWEPPVEEEIPEPEQTDTEETLSYAAPAVSVTVMEGKSDTTDAKMENEEKEESLEEEEEVPSIVVAKPKGMDAKLDSAVAFSESVSEPVVVKKEEPVKKQRKKPDLSPEKIKKLLEEDVEDISERGIRYRTLKSTIQHVRYAEEKPHFVFAGGEEHITLAVAKRVTKELNHVGYVSAHSIVKITAEKLNEIDLMKQMDKIQSGCMLVTSAPELNKKAVEELLEALKKYEDKIVVMLSGPFDEMDCFLEIYPELSKQLVYKVRM